MENVGEGTDLVQAANTFTLGVRLENLTFTGNGLVNTITGTTGNNRLDAGPRSTYTVSGVGASYTVTDTNNGDGDEGTDTLTGIERLQFSDGLMKLGRLLADNNGDGTSDLLWRNTDGSTSLWLMNGTSVQTFGSFGVIPSSWNPVAAADLAVA